MQAQGQPPAAASDPQRPTHRHQTTINPTPQVSLCLPDLTTAAAQLWPAYVKPLGAHPPGRPVGEERVAELFAKASSKAAALARSFEPGASAAGITGGGAGGLLALQGLAGAGGELELPAMSKFLLVAAYIASRNRPSVDKQLFENSTGSRRRGGGRRRGGQQSQDRQAEAAKAAQLKGPHSFTLQRLLHIYRMLRRADPGCAAGSVVVPVAGGSSAAAAAAAALFGGSGGAGAAGGGSNGGAAGAWGTAAAAAYGGGDDVLPLDLDGAPLLSSIAGLVGRRLLSGGGSGDDALAAPRYACEAPAAVAEQVALELRVNLAAYLRYV